MSNYTKALIKSISNIHFEGKHRSILLLSTPRSGSTWLSEIIASQPYVRLIDEPLNVMRPNVKYYNVFSGWPQTMPNEYDDKFAIEYIGKILQGKYKLLNPSPLRPFYRPITNRTIIKTHCLEHLINVLQEEFDIQIVYLIRNPITTTLSRYQCPRLEHFVDSEFYRSALEANGALSRVVDIWNNGSGFDKGILDWCFQNYYPMKFLDMKGWLVITYEELLINPEAALKLLLKFFDMNDAEKMRNKFNLPSTNIGMSDGITRKIINSKDENKAINLIMKYKNKVEEDQLKRAYEILEMFKIDAYKYESPIACQKYMNFEDTKVLFENARSK